MKEIKVEWCEAFILKTYKKLQCRGIEVNCFWDKAEKAGLWERGTYGSPMSQALGKLVTCEHHCNDKGQHIYTAFVLK